ncbi:NADPH-dependent oxidoreductase [Paucilactobacillus kaifaensis]|uniref:NADPH-dependent oxidoreductase n=1 Tax=Paucilactobacillus kaifaensis TaxID=2559921 RepID=UPI0010F89769|nr:NADPH-dependent oxidoreductase [Paucilactobacillus kaifaensis]
MDNNQTLKNLLNHRSIRNFKNQQLDQATIDQLISVASHTATSMFMQQFSIISVTDPAIKHAITEITGHSHAENNGHLFVFIADQYRNYLIGKAADQSTDLLGETDRLFAGVYDASIASEALTAAAESMGLGAVYLGSILNEPQQMIDLLKLPKLTFPVFAIAVGYPMTIPEQKPRLPLDTSHFANQYTLPANYSAILDDYDSQLTDYYQHRGTNTRVETFRHNIERQISKSPKHRRTIFSALQHQGFLLHEH